MNIRNRVSRIALGPFLTYASGWTMRVWRNEPLEHSGVYVPGRTHVDPDIHGTIQRFVQLPTGPLDLAKAILELERVTRCEVVDVSGNGEDLHK